MNKIVALLYFQFVFLISFAQNIDHKQLYDFLKFEYITVDDGLKNNKVVNITEDKDGFLWFRTDPGLCKFDGYTIKNYSHNPSDTNSLTKNSLTVLFNSSEDRLYIASKGLYYYNPKIDGFVEIKNKNLTKKRISSISEDKDKNIWIAASSNIIKYNPTNNNIKSYSLKKYKNIPSKCNLIKCTRDNNIWIAFRKLGVARFNPKTETFKMFNTDPGSQTGIDIDNIYALHEDKNSNLWIGGNNESNKKGVTIYNPLDSSFSTIMPDPKNETSAKIRTIFEDKTGRLFLGTRAGIYLFDEKSKSFSSYANKNHTSSRLNQNSVQCSYIDKRGGVWIGTFAGGANHADLYHKPFIHYQSRFKSKYELNDNLIYCFKEDKKGNLWIGTDQGGLNYLDRKSHIVTTLTHSSNNPNSLSFNQVTNIEIDKSNNLWIATNGGGLNYYNTKSKQFTHYKNSKTNPNSIQGDKIYKILLDSRENLWISVNGEIDRLDKGSKKFKHYNFKRCYREIREDKNGNIWFGLHNGIGIYNYQSDSIKYRFIDTINSTASINFDTQGNIWFGSKNGIFFYNTKKDKIDTTYTNKNFEIEQVYGILEDEQFNLWISTVNGLFKLVNIVKNPYLLDYVKYTPDDNIQSNQFNYNAYYKSPSGEMFFGGINGFNSFYPELIKENPFYPNIVFSGLKIFNQKVSINKEFRGRIVLKEPLSNTEELTLNHKEYIFTIEFVAIHHSNPDQNKYAYMLEGLDEDWNYSNQRYATYTNLEAGEYTFKVKAANSDDLWTPEAKEIKIIILPPFWKTLWFRLLVFIFIASSIVSFYLIRINQIKKQKEHLEDQVRIRTSELKEAIAELQIQKEEIIAQNEEINQQSEEISAQRDAVNAQNEEIKDKNKEVSKSLNNLKIISEFGQKITSTLKLESINAMIYKYVKSLVNISAFGIGIYKDDFGHIEYVGYMENGHVLPPFVNNINDRNSLSIWCLIHNKEIIISDFERDYKNYIKEKIPVFTQKRPESYIYIPLVVEKKKIGVMTAQNFEKNAFSESDLTNLQSLASYISISLDNANFYNIINKQNNKITSSIEYAKNIQDSILPIQENINKFFETFIIFKPKDIVSGDFYWYVNTKHENDKEYVFLAVVDCTGHGVPGAFMSLIGNRLLNEIVTHRKIYNTDKILEYLNIGVQLALKQEQTNNNDGMDVCLVRLEKLKNDKINLMFTGAKRDLYYATKETSEIQKLKSDRKSIGGIRARKSSIEFTSQEMELNKDDILYLTSDGLVDQNKPNREKYGTIKFIRLLNKIKDLTFERQQEIINKNLVTYMQNTEQRDDITILGVKL